MNRSLAADLMKVFDTPWTVEIIVAYADYEIDKANRGLQTASDLQEIHRLQGVVRAMLNLKLIREQAQKTLKG